eukprot:5725283-Pleurochrysis_carterae.AAC.1
MSPPPGWPSRPWWITAGCILDGPTFPRPSAGSLCSVRIPQDGEVHYPGRRDCVGAVAFDRH